MPSLMAMIHATATVIPIVESAAATYLPGVEIVHLLDEGMLRELSRAGHVTAELRERFLEISRAAARSNPDILFVTCSSFSQLIPYIRQMLSLPVLGPDEAMIEDVVARWSSAAIVATIAPAITSATSQLEAHARSSGKSLRVSPVLVDRAFAARKSGDIELHDRLVIEAIRRSTAGVDGVMLCQFTIAHLSKRVERELGLPAVSSLESAFRRAARLLGCEYHDSSG